MKKIGYILIVFLLIAYVVEYCREFDMSFKKNKIIVYEAKETNDTYDSKLENYVIGVVACEMPALYRDDALKAQAIASRTFALVIGDYMNSKGQCYISVDQMKEKWGSSFEKYYNKIKEIVNETENMVVEKNNNLLKTYYFSTSNGYTVDSVSVFKQDDIKSVDSPWDKSSKEYKYVTKITKEKMNSIFGNIKNIKVKSRDKTNHVLELIINDKIYTGIEFRKLLNLRSTDFMIEEFNDYYSITTYGYGHGVGMSQTGANELAKLGYDYNYILKYYYGDIEIKKYV